MSQDDVDLAYGLALELCNTCRDYHLTRPYLVASAVRSGPARDRAVFAPLLDRLVGPGARILIAGAADEGLLAFILDEVGDRRPEVCVADQCETPLTLCRRLASARGRTIRTMAVDLIGASPFGEFDVIVAHATLHFFPPELRALYLARLAGMLAQGGKLIVAYPTGHRAVALEGFVARVLAGLEANGISLPEPPGTLLAALARFAAASGKSLDASLTETEALFAAAGLQIVERYDSTPSLGRRGANAPLPYQPRRYVVAVVANEAFHRRPD